MDQRLVLAVDSCEKRLVLLHQVLVHLGFPVVLANGGEEAVAQAARHRPAAIVMGMGTGGGEAMGTLRALATHGWAAITPVIAVVEGRPAAAVAARVAAVVQQPIVLRELSEALNGCFAMELCAPGASDR